MSMRIHSLIFAVLLIPGIAGAAGGDGDEGGASGVAPKDPVIAAFASAKAEKDWVRAAAVTREAVSRKPNNADYHNLYAFALRKGPNADMDLVFKHYREALRLNPEHRGAHEYIGEAYLIVGDLPKAQEHLAVLDRLCLFGCDEYDDLKKAVAAYEPKR